MILDTHTWLWWQDGDRRLPKGARQRIDRAQWLGVPTACCLEIATLDRRGRIRLDRDVRSWVHAALADERVTAVPLSAAIAVEAGRLPESFPGDPVDRVVYATAVALDYPLVTGDERISTHDPDRVIW